jgi:hypothetical protein
MSAIFLHYLHVHIVSVSIKEKNIQLRNLYNFWVGIIKHLKKKALKQIFLIKNKFFFLQKRKVIFKSFIQNISSK